MKAIGLAAAVCGILASGAAMADDAMTPVRQSIEALNKGDMTAAAAAFGANLSVIDEFAPYHWNSADAWLKSFVASNKAYGVTEPRVILFPATTSIVDATEAYEVIPNVTEAKMGGKRVLEKGIFVFALTKMTKGWRIASLAWTKQ